MQAESPADTTGMPKPCYDPQPVIRRTALASTLLLVAAALAARADADVRPFLLMAVALVPQTVSLALTLVHPDRKTWVRPDALTGWLLRGIATLVLVPGIVEPQRLWTASAVAAVALTLAGWPRVLIAVKPAEAE